ncbi:MAG: Gfo/Idh/MocA family oxidoreductase [Acidobacteria bacterium]|nr:Gfo/Idh/MocA family oxidoreductase [Acidobacteriota bacterium]
MGSIARAHSNAFHQVGRFFDLPYALLTKVVCGRDPARLEKFAGDWGWSEHSLDWATVVRRPDIDIVDIAAPNALHAPVALRALEAGKIVFSEKPLAANFLDAREMAEAATRTKIPTLVWFNYRRAPAVAFSRQLIEEGRLGEIYHYRSYYFNQSGTDPLKAQTWRYRLAEAGSGAIGDLLSHSLETAIYLNGKLAELSAMKHTFIPGREVDDAVLVMAKFAHGGLGTFEASRFGVGRYNGYGFEIYGSKGSLTFDQEEMNRLRFFDSSEPAPTRAYREILVTGPGHPYSTNFWKPGHLVGYEHTFIATLADFLECLGKGEPFHPDFRDAAEVERVLEVVKASAASRQWTRIPI